MFRMGQLTQLLMDHLLPNGSFPVYDATTGLQVGQFMVQNGVRVGAPVNTKTQAVRPIMVGLLTDLKSRA